jgi:GNAT superfamily N-acetyltransferase
MSAVDQSPVKSAVTESGRSRTEPGWLLAGPFLVRRAAERDRQALARMLVRCSGDTRYRRFHGHVSEFPERYLTEALSGSPVHFALVASTGDGAGDRAGDGAVVALASCRLGVEGTAELSVLVEDAWQQLGVGGLLLREVVSYALATGLTTLTAQVLTDQAWLVQVLRRYGTCATVRAGEVLDVTLRLATPRD